ncbi:efflux RND transporter periplasmic adaptor subunit [Flavobacterium sp. HBTb2-11-1]|uniref:efflux RND transporter periplasmic adaptor subunit n=1 Tax=Flavobacterium sp. HBTb2-11-1 TaxID=2692212 RepID=UPI0013715756|nr:efflux RND transporter periplasmic adaptor subunit [Flavobacterium sp. HBTb2-11-1]MXO07000.1 efflux RND transporter periplasmic adaptor subunit [Flavobacterium sp. HBTb2-11-1]
MKNISENNLTAKSAKILTQSSQSLISLRALLPIAIGIALFAVTLISCSEKKTEEPQEEEKETTEVVLTVSQYKTVGIETGNVEDRNLNKIIKANGYTTVPPQNSAEVSTLIGGTVKDIFVLEGTFVNKGKVLATIQNLEVIGMQEDYQSAIANVEYLQLEYNRQKTLSEENVNPRKTFQEVKAKLAAERARAQAAKNKLDALHVNTKGTTSVVPIVSPIKGFVGKINIAKGAFANTGVSLFEVVDNSQMHLDLNVYEKDLGSISIGQVIDFVLTNQSNRSIKGKIFGINKSFSNESKTVAVHAKIDPADAKGLIPGMYVSANINIVNATVPALPKDAVVKNADKYFVFVQEDEKAEEKHDHKEGEKEEVHEHEVHFKALEVIPGTTDLGFTEVKFVNDVPANAKIVTKGAFYLLSAMKGGGEHTH